MVVLNRWPREHPESHIKWNTMYHLVGARVFGTRVMVKGLRIMSEVLCVGLGFPLARSA